MISVGNIHEITLYLGITGNEKVLIRLTIYEHLFFSLGYAVSAVPPCTSPTRGLSRIADRRAQPESPARVGGKAEGYPPGSYRPQCGEAVTLSLAARHRAGLPGSPFHQRPDRGAL